MSSDEKPRYGLTEAKQIYDLYRDYVKHEDELINRRLSWNLTLQGFLFAAYGVSFQIVGSKPYLRLLPCVFPVVGGLVAFLVLMSILAAQEAIRGLETHWLKPLNSIEADVKEMLPELTGGSQKFAKFWGWVPQVYIPGVIMAAWVALLWIATSAQGELGKLTGSP
jgi:hypothetical protein